VDGNKIIGDSKGIQLTGAANTISGNLVGGSLQVVAIEGDQNTLTDNMIGTDATGALQFGGGTGIYVNDVVSTTIGGNLIGRNGVGVKLVSAEVTHLYGNGIGTNISNTLSIPNTSHGIYLTQGSRNNSIGQNVMAGDFSSPFNQIRNNGGRGILIADAGGIISLDNSMVGNEFSNNGALAIDLANDGVTANDTCDVDEGQNDLQNFPVLTGITAGGDIQGTLNSRPSPPYQIDVYTSATCDGLGNGEGGQYFGSTSIVLGVSGEANFTVAQLTPATPLAYYTAIATNLNTGNTSEFSTCYLAGVPTGISLAGQTTLLSGQLTGQLVLLFSVIVVTLWAIRNKRQGAVLLLIMLVVVGAAFVPSKQVQPLVSAAEEEVATCGAFANLLEDGSSAQSGSGVVVGAVAGTLAAPVYISANVTEPSSAYDYAGPAAVVSDYYAISAETTTLAPVDKPFLVGVPVPLGQSPNNLGIALLRNVSDVREGGESGFVWKHAPASYDSSSNLLTFTLNQLTEDGQIFAIVHDPLIEQLPAPTRRASRDVQTTQFSVTCFLVACTPAVKAAYETELLIAYNDFMSHGFRQPRLGNSTAYFDTSGTIPLPFLSPLTTFNTVSLTLPDLCSDYVGQYDPNTTILEICTQALPITAEIRRTIRHELFHAI
ncbi:MAG TPA: hypothetical protein ENJ56_02450, partial [Anaerolineae bacterium]|nr:hypothetical protein [Anaerolineae bacterium]